MPELIPQNQEPLNRAARKALEKAGQVPLPESLYALQLAHWALETGKATAQDSSLDEYVETLLYRRTPEWGLKALLVQVEDENHEVPVDFSPGMSPVRLAASILENLSMSLALQNPDYRDADRLNTMRAQ